MCWGYLAQQIVYVSWEQTVCGCPLPTGHYSSIKGLRHMVIQIQFRYSQFRGLQHREHQIGQVNSLGPQERVEIYEKKRLMSRFIHLDFWAVTHAETDAIALLFRCCAVTLHPCTTPAKLLRSYTRGPGCHFHPTSLSRSTGKTGCI